MGGPGSVLGIAGLAIWLGAIPAVIFTLFFAIPLLRAPFVWWQNRTQHSHNIRKRFYRVLFGVEKERLARSEIIEQANQIATTEEKLRIADVGELLDETLSEIGGEQDVDERGELTTDLTRLQVEARAAEQHALEQRKAQVVYRTD